ncbi:MAG TPA: universal stress protein, partial [Syntrophorhabdales bacterium]|nr:universal stress protein [Syntrophorhabdales bacterium]
MLRPTKILVPTDFSEYSDKALKQALDIATQYKAKVFVLHVIHEQITQCVYDYCLPTAEVQRAEEQLMASAKQNLQKQLEKFPAAKEVEVTADVRKGHPSEEILKEEEEKGIDLIVIASLGQTGLRKYLIGSIARNVLKGAKCPVL